MLVAAACALLTLLVLTVSHWHGPFRDMWEIYPFLQKIVEHSWGWQDLWEAYGYSHRLVIPRLLFAADYSWSAANNHLLISISIVCQALIIFLLSRTIIADQDRSAAERGLFIAVFILFQLSGTLLFNLLHTFDVQWFLVCFFVVFSCKLLVDAAEPISLRGKYTKLTLAFVFSLAACGCNFSAMAIWPIFIYFSFRAVGRVVGVYLLLLAIFLGCYSQGVHSELFGNMYWQDAGKLLVYLAAYFPAFYLSNPLSNPHYLAGGYLAAGFALIAMLYLLHWWWRILVCQQRARSSDQILAALALFSLGVAMMTALGRGYDPSHVRAMRYQNIVMLFWSAMLPLLLMQQVYWHGIMQFLARSVASLVLVGMLIAQPIAWNEALLLGKNVARSHLALMLGYSDNIPLISATVSRSMIYVPGYTLEKERALHEQANQGIYSGATATYWLHGLPLDKITKTCGELHWSTVTGNDAEPLAFNVVADPAGLFPAAPAQSVLLASKSGEVLGVAIPDQPSNLPELIPGLIFPKPTRFRGWFGRHRGSAVEVLVILSSSGRPEDSCKRLLP